MSATAQRAPSFFSSDATSSSQAAESAIFFPDGLVGCPAWRRFVQVVDEEEDLPVLILQCLDDTAVQLLVTDPSMLQVDYTASLNETDRAALGLPAGVAPTLYCTLTVGADGSISANLLGPLVVNPVTRRGLQVVLADTEYSTRHPVTGATAPDGRD
jgi:flagellar assembly factor FliW